MTENNCNFDDFVVLRYCNSADIEAKTSQDDSNNHVRPIINGYYVFLNFWSVTHPVLIDTGASISMVNKELLKLINPNFSSRISANKIPYTKMVDGTATPIIGKIYHPFFSRP